MSKLHKNRMRCDTGRVVLIVFKLHLYPLLRQELACNNSRFGLLLCNGGVIFVVFVFEFGSTQNIMSR